MYSMYILESNEWMLYIASTQDIQERVNQHNNWTGWSYTRRFNNRKLIYLEDFESRYEAMKRERKLKSLKLWIKIKDILLNYLTFIPR